MAFKLSSKNSILFPQEKKQQKLIIVLVVLFLITFIILYFSFFRSSAPTEPVSSELSVEMAGQGMVDIRELIEEMDFDKEFFKQTDFQALKVYGDWPLNIEQKGRENPFLPY